MRLVCCCFALIACAAAHAQDGSDPNLRFKAMHDALERAKTLSVEFEALLTTDKEKVPVQGKLVLAKGNRARIDTTYELGGMKVEITIVSDGKTTRTLRKGAKPKERPTDPQQNANYLAMLQRGGFAVPMFTVTAAKGKADPDMSKLLQVSNLKYLRDEKPGEYHCSYQLTIEEKVRFNVELVTDVSSNLPLRRIISVDKGADPVNVRETYRIERDIALKGGTFTIEP